MGSLGIVLDEVVIEDGLHLVEGLKPGAAALDAEMLVEKRAVPALDNAAGLWPVDPGSLALDLFELQEQLVGMAVLAAAELAAVVGQHGVDLGSVRLKGRQHIIVDQLDGGDCEFVGGEPGPSMPAVAVDGGVQIDLAEALQDANEEGVDGNQRAGVRRLDMALAVFRAEPLEQRDLFLREGELALGRGLLQPQQPIVLGQ